MKTTRRFIAMTAALTLTACAAMPMFGYTATVPTGQTGNKITISNFDNATHTYAAYQIFSGDMSGGVLRNIVWGDGVDYTNLLAELKSESAKLGSPLEGLFPATVTDAKGVAEVLGSKSGSPETAVFDTDSDKAKAFAEIVGKHLSTQTSGNYSNNAITGLPDGYYLVQDASEPTNGAKTRFIVKVTDQATVSVNAKHSVPSVEKKVKENVKEITGKATHKTSETDKWNDVADYNIGDSVPFKLYGTLPTTYADYEHYYYKFTDTLGNGFAAPNVNAISVYVGDTKINPGKNMRVKVVEQTITVSFEDIKEFATNANDIITVEYNAVLDTDAQIGLPGNENQVKLDYSNNPNYEYNPKTDDDNENFPGDNGTPNDTSDDTDETGETKPDTVIVFTYQLDVTKEDNKTNDKLQGAEFKLKNSENQYAIVSGNNKITDWTSNETEGSVFTSAKTTGKFSIIGLDDGTYTLIETKAPDGYNTPSTNTLVFTINAETENNQSWNGSAGSALKSLKITAAADQLPNNINASTGLAGDTDSGIVAPTVYNTKGSTLPSTGGIGTTLFFLGGGCLAGLTGVLLITKKRTKDAEANPRS